MTSVLRGVAWRVASSVRQAVTAFSPKTAQLCCNSLAQNQQSNSTSRYYSSLYPLRPIPPSVCGGRYGSERVTPLPGTITSASLTSPTAFSSSVFSPSSLLTKFTPVMLTQTRDYHVRKVLKLRCSGCYFVRRRGRLFVECKTKPRHKQMQIMAKRNLFRDDYTKGNVPQAVFWKYGEQRYYKQGDNEYARHDWLKGKIGVTV